jgi:hypothetical protein
VRNAEETSVGRPKKAFPPEALVAVNTKPGSAIIPEARDDAQFTLLKGVPAFGHPTCPPFISKLKRVEQTLPTAEKLYKGHDYIIPSAPRTFITEILFIDWLETFFLPHVSELRQKFDCNGRASSLSMGIRLI